MKYDQTMPALPEEDWLFRALYCAAVLHAHDFLTVAERKKVHARMMKQKAKETKESK